MNGASAVLCPRTSSRPKRKMRPNIGIIHHSFCRHRKSKNSAMMLNRSITRSSFDTRSLRRVDFTCRTGKIRTRAPARARTLLHEVFAQPVTQLGEGLTGSSTTRGHGPSRHTVWHPACPREPFMTQAIGGSDDAPAEDGPTRPRRRAAHAVTRWLVSAVLATVGGVMSLLIIDIGLAIVYPQVRIITYDPRLGTLLRPNLTARKAFGGHERVVTITTNAFGLRGPDLPVAKPAGTRRILAL